MLKLWVGVCVHYKQLTKILLTSQYLLLIHEELLVSCAEIQTGCCFKGTKMRVFFKQLTEVDHKFSGLKKITERCEMWFTKVLNGSFDVKSSFWMNVSCYNLFKVYRILPSITLGKVTAGSNKTFLLRPFKKRCILDYIPTFYKHSKIAIRLNSLDWPAVSPVGIKIL